MNPINDISALPELANRAHWSQILGIDAKTLARAERRGLRASRPNARTVLYTREAIVGYLKGS
jgi:hypothetical protein